MKILIPGHAYELPNFDNKEGIGQKLQFIHKEPISTNSTTLALRSDGTTTEDVLEVLIDRTETLQAKFPCKENANALNHLEEALMWLEKRTV